MELIRKNKKLFTKAIAGSLLLLSYTEAAGQTCCTGGAPLTGNFRVTSMDKGNIGANFAFDFNQIRDFYLEDRPTNDDYLKRYTHTLFAQFNYGLATHTTVSVLIPYLWLGEKVTSQSDPVNNRASGLGDLFATVNQLIVLNDYSSLYIGGGVKLPTGATKKRGSDGLVLQATLQPGTGSFDYLVNGQYQASLPFRRSMIFRQAFFYKRNSSTDQFTIHDSYKFGNEVQSFTGVTDQILIGKILHNPSLLFRYRYQEKNLVEGFPNENTGGHWVYFVPGWQIQVSPKILAGVNGEIPLYRSLNGFQITTTYKIVVTLAINLSSKNAVEYGF